MMMRLARGMALAAPAAWAGLLLRALSPSGAVAAAAVGTSVYAGRSWSGSTAMLLFFLSSTALSRLPSPRATRQRRGNRRDAIQVLANGAVPAFLALLSSQEARPPSAPATLAFFGCLAAATADTWATEIGTRWGREPRNILTGQSAAPGESGAVTVAGLAAGAGGSLLIGLVPAGEQQVRLPSPAVCVASGLLGSLADSVLGASIQERRWCPACCTPTERIVHECGIRTLHVSGIEGVNNDVVNLIAVATGGAAAAGLTVAVSRLTARNGSRVEFV